MKQRGGRRPGAGRPKSSRNKTQGQGAIKMASAQALTLAYEGLSPLQYMLDVMRQTDDDLIEMERAGVIDTVERIKLQAQRNKRRDRASQAAAPYVHPRLAAADPLNEEDRPINVQINIVPVRPKSREINSTDCTRGEPSAFRRRDRQPRGDEPHAPLRPESDGQPAEGGQRRRLA